jgi:LexA-binding, inner membrane-associated putative hydrolase
MLITNHVLSGALIGAAAESPAVALPLGVASHFALDALPHWGEWLSKSHFLRVAVADGLTGLAVMGAAAAVTPHERRAAVIAGMVGAAVPDIDKPTRIFFGFSPFPRRVDEFHSRIQDEAPGRFYSHEVVAAAAFAAGFAALTVAARVRARKQAKDADTVAATGESAPAETGGSGTGTRIRAGLSARARDVVGLLAPVRQRL